MAVEALRPPVYAARVIIANTLAMTPEWYRPLANLFARVLGLSQVTSITTPNVAAAAAITQDPITNSYTAAGAGYVQLTAQTWVDGLTELKADVNILTDQLQDTRTQLNLAIALVNELKAKHNSQTAALNP
jgi:hypoxanthine phosphoribosyltransferase